MTTFHSAHHRRVYQKQLSLRRFSSTLPYLNSGIHAPMPKSPADAALVDWSDPDKLRADLDRIGGSNVDLGNYNARKHREYLEANGPRLQREYEKKCEQDEARIRNCDQSGPFISNARGAWWTSAPRTDKR